MSSFIRRMQRAAGPPMRNKPSGIPNFGTKLGVTNPKAPKPYSLGARGSRRRIGNSKWRAHREPAGGE